MTDRHEAALRAALAERDELVRNPYAPCDIVGGLPITSEFVVTRIVEAALAAADEYDDE